MRRYGFTVVLILFFIPAIAAVANDGQAISISKKLSLFNNNPRSAAGTKTGDVLVTWQRFDFTDYSDYHDIYAAFCKRKNNGKYTVSNARLVSDKKQDCGDQSVAYNPKDNSYLVVYHAYNKTKDGSSWDLFARKVDSRGKPKGSPYRVTDAESGDTSPVIQYNPDASAAPASKGCYIVAYYRNPGEIGGTGKEGLHTLILNKDGRIAGSGPVLIRSPKGNDGMLPDSLQRAHNGSYLLGATRSYNDGNSHQAYAFKLSVTGKKQGQSVLATYKSCEVSLIQLSKKLYLAAWRKQVDWIEDTANRLLKPNLKPKGGELSALKGAHEQMGKPVKLGKDTGAYEVFSYSTQLRGRYISSKGKIDKDSELLTLLDHYIVSLGAVGIPGTNEVFAVWAERDENKAKVKAYVFAAK